MEKFKVGDVVYDEVNYPNQKGVVEHVYGNKSYIYICKAKFGGNLINYDVVSIKFLSHTPYTIEFKGFSQERPKVLTDEMKVCIKGDGTMEYGAKIIEYLKSLGGIDHDIPYNGSSRTNFYYISEKFIICQMSYIPQGYKQITLKDEVKQEQVCYVGKKIEYNGSILLIIQQDKSSVDVILDGKQDVIMIDDIINGLYRIID